MFRIIVTFAALAALGACETMPPGFFNQITPAASETATPASPSYAPTPEQQLLDLERQLSASAQERGLGAALASAIDAGDGFVLRPGQLYQGPEAVQQGLGGAAGAMFWQPDRVFVSQAGDMGVTSGRYVQVVAGAEAIQGRYVAVWRKDQAGEWRILSESRVADPPARRR